MSNRAGRPNTLVYHKPNCKCPPCTRKAKALARGDGAGGEEMVAPTRLPDLSPKSEVIQAPNGTPILLEDRSHKSRVLQIIALRGTGMKDREIGEKLGIETSTVRKIIYRANKDGLIKYDDPLEHFEEILVPKVVQNIEHWLDQKDKKMTIEAAKGAGIFKSHQALKVQTETPQTILALKIEMPTGSGDAPKQVIGRVVGKPRRVITGEVE